MSQTVTYSYATDFGSSFDGRQMAEEVADSSMTQTLIRSRLDGDDVNLDFDAPVSGADLTTLNSLVAAHTPESVDTRFMRNVGDADQVISDAEFRSKHLRTGALTANRAYRFKNAVKMIESGLNSGSIWIINQSNTYTITIEAKVGGLTTGDMVVQPNTSAHFRWKVTDYTPSSEAYRILRLS